MANVKKWYVNDNFISRKLDDKDWHGNNIVAECESHEVALEIVEAHNLDFGARQITQSKRWQLHVKSVLSQEDLKDIIYAAMHYAANITPKFLQALTKHVIENWNKGEENFTQTKEEINHNYFWQAALNGTQVRLLHRAFPDSSMDRAFRLEAERSTGSIPVQGIMRDQL